MLRTFRLVDLKRSTTFPKCNGCVGTMIATSLETFVGSCSREMCGVRREALGIAPKSAASRADLQLQLAVGCKQTHTPRGDSY